MDQIFAIEVEVRFIGFYKDAPLFHEVYKFITSLGFELFDLNRYFYKKKPYTGFLKGQLGMADALFFINVDKFIARCKSKLDAGAIREKMIKAIIIASFYGYIGYAIELLEKSEDTFDKNEYSDIMRDLLQCKPLSEKIPHFRGKGLIYRVLKKLTSLFLSSHQGAFHSDNTLGTRKLH